MSAVWGWVTGPVGAATSRPNTHPRHSGIQPAAHPGSFTNWQNSRPLSGPGGDTPTRRWCVSAGSSGAARPACAPGGACPVTVCLLHVLSVCSGCDRCHTAAPLPAPVSSRCAGSTPASPRAGGALRSPHRRGCAGSWAVPLFSALTPHLAVYSVHSAPRVAARLGVSAQSRSHVAITRRRAAATAPGVPLLISHRGVQASGGADTRVFMFPVTTRHSAMAHE